MSGKISMYSGEEARFVHRRMPRLLVRTAKFQRKPHVESHIATSNYCLAPNLNQCRCQHLPGFHHDHAKGSETPKTAYYPEAMARTISEMSLPRARFLNASDCYRWVKKIRNLIQKFGVWPQNFWRNHPMNQTFKIKVQFILESTFSLAGKIRTEGSHQQGKGWTSKPKRANTCGYRLTTKICQLNRTLGE